MTRKLYLIFFHNLNNSLFSSVFLSDHKMGVVFPIHKKKHKVDIEN